MSAPSPRAAEHECSACERIIRTDETQLDDEGRCDECAAKAEADNFCDCDFCRYNI